MCLYFLKIFFVAGVIGVANLVDLLDTPDQRALVLDVLVPVFRRAVGGDDDDLWCPVNEASLDGDGHLVAIEDAQHLGVLDVSIEVVDKDHLVSIIPIKPIARGLDVDV